MTHASEPEGVLPGRAGRRDTPTIAIVLGMHRAGTSLCSRALTLLGVDMASEANEGPGNERGHFERWEIMHLHDEILALFDRAYYSPTHDFPLPAGWWLDARVRPVKEKLKATLAPFLERGAPFGFKDPRTARLMPMWRDIFFELGVRPRFAVCLRDPAHIAVSLHTRDNLPIEVGEVRALNYFVDALRYTQPHERCLVRFDDWFANPTRNAELLAKLVGRLDLHPADRDAAFAEAIDPAMNRSASKASAAKSAAVRRGHALAEALARSPDDVQAQKQWAEYALVYAELRQASAVHERPYRDLEATLGEKTRRLEEGEARLRETEAALASLQDALTSLQAQRDELVLRAEAAEGQLAALTAERDPPPPENAELDGLEPAETPGEAGDDNHSSPDGAEPGENDAAGERMAAAE